MYTAPFSAVSPPATEQLFRPPLHDCSRGDLEHWPRGMANTSDMAASLHARHESRFASLDARHGSRFPSLDGTSSTYPLPPFDSESTSSASSSNWVDAEFHKVFPPRDLDGAAHGWTGWPSRRFPYASTTGPPLHFPREVNGLWEQSDGQARLDFEMGNNHWNSFERVEDAKQPFESNWSSGQLSVQSEYHHHHHHLGDTDSSRYLDSQDELPDLSPAPSHSSSMYCDQSPDEVPVLGALPPARELDDASDVPYAQLIYRALMSVPTHQMILQDIYEWFERHTDKPEKAKMEKTAKSRNGWKNSIRHNLSMNGAFRKVERVMPFDGGKNGFIWVLGDEAIQRGYVESTTRYRKVQAAKKALAAPRTRAQAQGPVNRREVKHAIRLDQAEQSSRHPDDLTSSNTPDEQTPEPDGDAELESPVECDPYADQGPIHHPLGFSYASALSVANRPFVYGDPMISFANSIISPEQLLYSSFRDRYTDWEHIDPRLAQHTFCDSSTHHTGCEFGGLVA